jgi:hypothetical protein
MKMAHAALFFVFGVFTPLSLTYSQSFYSDDYRKAEAMMRKLKEIEEMASSDAEVYYKAVSQIRLPESKRTPVGLASDGTVIFWLTPETIAEDAKSWAIRYRHLSGKEIDDYVTCFKVSLNRYHDEDVKTQTP